jgi:CDGSH-type Zn-finger protein
MVGTRTARRCYDWISDLVSPGARRNFLESEEEKMAKVKITVRPNGPYRVEDPEGIVELVDANGVAYPLPPRNPEKPWIALCRCGGSVKKPFCDGAHSRIGFQAAEAAVSAEEGKK